MFYSLLLIAGLGGGLYALARWRKLPLSDRKGFAQKAILWGAVVVIVVLVLAGRAPWLMGVLAALLALASRAAQFAQYIPMFKKIFGEDSAAANTDSSVSPPGLNMSCQEAADILGVEIDATRDDIRMAHKKLMQKLHPDRGGSDALAKQINNAKDRLLS